MKNPELALKKYIFNKLGKEVAGFEYCDYPPNANFEKEKYLWINTSIFSENGSKAGFISTVNAELTFVTKEQNGYNSTLSLEQGKDAVMQILVSRGLNEEFQGFNIISSNLQSSGSDFETVGNKKVNYSKININFVLQEI